MAYPLKTALIKYPPFAGLQEWIEKETFGFNQKPSIMKQFRPFQLLPFVFLTIAQQAFGHAYTINSFAPTVGSVGVTTSFITSEFSECMV